MRYSLTLLLALLFALPAFGVIVDGDETGTTLPPPGTDWFWKVGLYSGGQTTAVYLGDGWFLTADHLGPRNLIVQGREYPSMPETYERVNDGVVSWDLGVFRVVEPIPEIVGVDISLTQPRNGDPIYMIGYGQSRGVHTPGVGWTLVSPYVFRWGTNNVTAESSGPTDPHYQTLFDEVGGTEAQATFGDSGGGVFNQTNELVGIMTGRTGAGNYGGTTTIYDVTMVRDEIIAMIAATGTVCNNGWDDDRDGLVDTADPDCLDASGTSESLIQGECVLP